ncbi:MAG: SMC-Scp complex subunit ScpB [Bacteroidota bacterium]|nr:SMC-Scp complex subunit ScpB [Bacteroidota bacterium]
MSDEQAEVKTEDVEVSTELKNIIEALIFASDEPMTVRFIRSIMDDVNKDLPPAEHYTVNADIIRKAVGDLNRGYGRMGSGFRIIEVAGGFVHATQEQFSSWVGKLAKERARRRLSPTAVETLAIIAYKQPIAKGEVEFIRGVNVDYIINALLEKDLIHITGRASTPGRPLLYGTTQKFLEHFGLNELSDLPKPREIEELIGETELEVDRRLLAEQQELEFKEDLEKKMDGNEGSKNKLQRGSKIKLEHEAKAEAKTEERRLKDAQKAAESQQSVVEQGESGIQIPEEKNMKEGETLSEINQQIVEETGEIENVPTIDAVKTENEQENLAISEQDHLETNGQGHSAINEQDLLETSDLDHSEINDQVHLAISEPDHLETNELENQMSDQDRLQENEVTSRSKNSEQVLNEAEDQRMNDQSRSVSDVLTENRVGHLDPNQIPIDQAHQTTDVGADHSDQSTESEHYDQEQRTESGSGQRSGWSKWKNKVKTFFQKLFA